MFTPIGHPIDVIQPGWIEIDPIASVPSNPIANKMQSSVLSNTVLLRRTGKTVVPYVSPFGSDQTSSVSRASAMSIGIVLARLSPRRSMARGNAWTKARRRRWCRPAARCSSVLAKISRLGPTGSGERYRL
jgi:hypothetical protein